MTEFDFIIVGAGSAGGPISDRLTESGLHSVLVLEAGSSRSGHRLSVPYSFAWAASNKEVNWQYTTNPEAGLQGRAIYWPRGKALGGSSAIGGAIYTRGLPSDYDKWEQLGNTGWSFADCLPFFKRVENCPPSTADDLETTGRVKITQSEYHSRLSLDFLKGCMEMGLQFKSSFKDQSQEGAGFYHATVASGCRISTAEAYVAIAQRRRNCQIISDAIVERIEFEGNRATGVWYRLGDQLRLAKARREVIVSAGVVGSPQLLQRSGLGPAALLSGLGIPVVHNHPGVGENLQDRLSISSVFETWWRITLNDEMNETHRRFLAAIRYAFFREGPLTANRALVGAFAALGSEINTPNIQVSFFPWSMDEEIGKTHPFSGITIQASQLHPESRGHVRICSRDVTTAPSIVANYLASEVDQRAVVSALRFVRALSRTQGFSRTLIAELKPSPSAATDADFLRFAQDEGQSACDSVGTCRMGNDETAVVDSKLRVRGIDGLRVADASIMPTLISGGTNAACMMIGEKAADMILERTRVQCP